MFKEDIKNIKSEPTDLKSFGLSIGLALILLAGFLFWKEKSFAFYFIVLGNVFVILGLLWPSGLKILQRPWMMLVVILGWFMSRFVLSIVFYVVVMPIGVIMRLFGKEFLDLKIDKSKQSYWQNRSAVQDLVRKDQYKKQF